MRIAAGAVSGLLLVALTALTAAVTRCVRIGSLTSVSPTNVRCRSGSVLTSSCTSRTA